MGSIDRFDVWYLSGEKAGSDDTIILYDDNGSLILDDEALDFKGSKMGLRIDRSGIAAVSLSGIRLTTKRALFALSAGLAIWLPIFLVALLISIPMAFLLDNWLTVPACLSPLMLGAVASALIGFLAGRTAKWVKVDFTDPEGRGRSAYFADRSGFGLGGTFGGTKRLYERISG